MELNTSHALYPNLVSLIGVDEGNSLIDLITPSRTFTKHAEASYVNSALGRAFRTVSNAVTPKGATLGTALPMTSTISQSYSIFIAFANYTGALSSGTATATMLGFTSGVRYVALPTFHHTSKLLGLARTVGESPATAVFTTEDLRDGAVHSVCATTESVSNKINGALYLDGEATSATFTNASGGTSALDMIGGSAANGSLGADYVWIAVFNKVLTGSEITDLHASLGANNQFALVAAEEPAADISWTEESDAISIAAEVFLPASGSIAWTEADDTVAISGNVASPTSAAIAWTEEDDAIAIEAAVDQSGLFVTEPLINNTGTILADTAVVWSWLPTGRIGALSAVAPTDGTGTTAADGTLTVTGLSGAGILMVAVQATDATDDAVYYQAGTVP